MIVRFPLSVLYFNFTLSTGKQEGIETITVALEVISEPFRSMATTLVDICAYAGTGNVLKVQQLLHICSEHYDNKEQVCNNNSNTFYSRIVSIM